MQNQSTIHEKFLTEIWRLQKFSPDIATLNDEKIVVLDVGQENTDLGGPDFMNARLKIGNITYVGDVEIDHNHQDWRIHGHNINKKFNKVILHVVLAPDEEHKVVVTQDGRRVPTLCITGFLPQSLRDTLQGTIHTERDKRTNKIPCLQVSSLADGRMKMNYLVELGVERFNKKCEKMVHRLKELIYLDSLKLKEPDVRYDLPPEALERRCTIQELEKKEIWEQLFYEAVFEALGYSQNKVIFRRLAEAVDMHFLHSYSSFDDFPLLLESVYLHVGGLMPEQDSFKDPATAEYVRSLTEIWGVLKRNYTGKMFTNEQWHFAKLRPVNFPTVRISGGARIVNELVKSGLVHTIIKKFTEIHSFGVLKSSVRSLFIIRGDGYWTNHYVFDKRAEDNIKYFVGTTRADEIFLNVIIPFVYIYFDLFGDKRLAAKAMKLYTEISLETENSLVKEISDSLSLDSTWHRSVIYQGMLELFRTYCTKNKCMECKIGTKVFND